MSTCGATDLASRTHDVVKADLAAALARLAATDEAGTASYDASTDTYQVVLTKMPSCPGVSDPAKCTVYVDVSPQATATYNSALLA